MNRLGVKYRFTHEAAIKFLKLPFSVELIKQRIDTYDPGLNFVIIDDFHSKYFHLSLYEQEVSTDFSNILPPRRYYRFKIVFKDSLLDVNPDESVIEVGPYSEQVDMLKSLKGLIDERINMLDLNI